MKLQQPLGWRESRRSRGRVEWEAIEREASRMREDKERHPDQVIDGVLLLALVFL